MIKLSILKKLAIFGRVSEETIQILRKAVVIKKYSKGRIIFKPDTNKFLDEKICYTLKLRKNTKTNYEILKNFSKISDSEYLIQVSPEEPLSNILEPLFREKISIYSIEQVRKETDSFILGYLE